MKRQRRRNRRNSSLKVVQATIAMFISINIVLGGVIQATRNDASNSREYCTLAGKQVVWIEDEHLNLEDESELLPIVAETTSADLSDSQVIEPNEVGLKIENITKDSTTTERIYAVFEYLIANGFTPEAAAGVLGNVAVESCFNPAVVSESGYYGLFQWNTNEGGNYWWYTISSWLTENGYEWDSFEGQIRAFVECSNKGQLDSEKFAELKNLRNVEQATELVTVFYEGCVGGYDQTSYYYQGSCYQDLNLRKEEAWIIYNMYLTGNEYNGQKPYSLLL